MSEPQSQQESQTERQRQVEALADEYLERLLAGETPDRQALLAAHPDLADLLGPRLELVELMHRAARAKIPAERAHCMKCPHCGNAIQLVEPNICEVTCGSCGSSFHIDPRATTAYESADLPRAIGKFEVLEQLGRGTFGTVYKARDPQLQRIVAVKVPRTGSFATSEEEERFLREARAAAQLSHPGIVPVLEIAHDRGVPYIVSEYVEGLTLADVLTARRPGFRDAAELVAAVADALDYAHRQKIVHRDVKPSNLLLDAAGRPHITDFGLARRGEGEITVTLDGQILGTPAYMAPEQAAGEQRKVDARSDVYSLGVVLYELLTGELPFRGNQRMLLHQVIHDEPRPPRSLNDRVPRDLETICLKAMAKTPARRYGSAQEMADDLRRFLNREPIRARRVGRTEKLVRWARRNPAVASLLATVALLLIALAVGGFLFALTERRLKRHISNVLDETERYLRESELHGSSTAVDLDLKHCQDGEIEYGVLRLARTLGQLPPHAVELRQCVEMNLLAWAQEIRPLGPIFQYDGAETKWKLSPDGLTVLTGGADGTARLWDAFTGEVRATLRGHRGEIASIDFSKNGRVAMTIGEDRIVRLWEASNGEARGATTKHPQPIENALLSSDGRRLLTICHEMRGKNRYDAKPVVTLWDTSTGQRVGILTRHERRVSNAAFSPDGKMVLTGGADKTGRLWSAENGRPLGTLEGCTGVIVAVAIGEDGATAATMEDSGLVRWWDLHQFRQIGPPCQSSGRPFGFHFLQPDVVLVDGSTGMGDFPGACCIRGLENSLEFPATDLTNCKADADCIVDTQGRVYDRKSGNRRPVPAKRKYGEVLVRFATAGRFLVLNEQLVDLRTETTIGKGAGRHFPDRQMFLAPSWPSLRYISLPSDPLDSAIARLFAEVVTLHELDAGGIPQRLKESEWEERRLQLVGRLKEHPAPFLMRRLAEDRWFRLRRQEDEAKDLAERINYLDRLIAREPIWQNYDRRAEVHSALGHWLEAARDLLQAEKLAGEGYWHQQEHSYWWSTKAGSWQVWHPSSSASLIARGLADPLTLPDRLTLEAYQLSWRLARALHKVNPDQPHNRLWLALACYRVGRYAEALPLLEACQRERAGPILARMAEYFRLGQFQSLLRQAQKETTEEDIRATAFLAMTHHRLGDPKRARAALDELRRMGEITHFGMFERGTWKTFEGYKNLLREAEMLIEGKPQTGK